jgi:hypothetical protein
LAVAPRHQPRPTGTTNCLFGWQSAKPKVTLTPITPHPPTYNTTLNPPTSIHTPLLYQTDINGKTIEKDDLESFRHIMGKKAVNVFCIMFQNINNLPTSASFNKSQQVIDCIIKQELDVFLMT